MGKNSTNVSFLKVIQGGKAELVKSPKALTPKDIKVFLAKFAEAILVDQERVNKLPHKKFHPFYDDGMRQRYRENHVDAILDLSMTVDEMPKRLLKNLTELAIAYKPEVVKKPVLSSISDLATRASSPWLYETASPEPSRGRPFCAENPATLPSNFRVANRRHGNDQSHGKKCEA